MDGLPLSGELKFELNGLLHREDTHLFREIAQMFGVKKGQEFESEVARKFVKAFGPFRGPSMFIEWLEELIGEIQLVGVMGPHAARCMFEGGSNRTQKMVTLCTDEEDALFTLTTRNNVGDVEQYLFEILYSLDSEKKFFVLNGQFDVFNSFGEMVQALDQSHASATDSSSNDSNDTTRPIKDELGKFLSGGCSEGPPRELLDVFRSIHIAPSRTQAEYVTQMAGWGSFLFRQSDNAPYGVVITALNKENSVGFDHIIIFVHVQENGAFLFSLNMYSVCSDDLNTILTVIHQLCGLELNTLVCSDARLCSLGSAVKFAGKSASKSIRDD